MNIPLFIAVAGDAGSFSEAVGRHYIQREALPHQVLHSTDAKGVLMALKEGRAQLGVLPIINTTTFLRDGVETVPMTRAVLDDAKLAGDAPRIIGSSAIRVSFNLCVKLGVDPTGVTKIVSHEQVLNQSRNTLEQLFPGVTQEAYVDSAKAGHDLIEGILPDSVAVVVPYFFNEQTPDLEVLYRNVQDNKDNLTVFAIVTA
jgi:prephenate dehydratase